MMTEQQIVGGLAGLDENSPAWLAVREVLRRQVAIELEALMLPNLTDSAAQYNRGRAAALMNFEDILVAAWQQSRVPAGG